MSDGKWAEAQVRQYLDDRSARELTFAFHRYPDAKSARGAMTAQPSDFLVSKRIMGIEGRTLKVGGVTIPFYKKAVHLEVKETGKTTRLPKKKVRQFGMLRKYHWAGIEPLVVVYMTEAKRWVYLTAQELFSDDDSASFQLAGLKQFESVDDLLESAL